MPGRFCLLFALQWAETDHAINVDFVLNDV